MSPLQKLRFHGEPALGVFQYEVEIVDELPVGGVSDLRQVELIRDDLQRFESFLDPGVSHRVPLQLLLDVLLDHLAFGRPHTLQPIVASERLGLALAHKILKATFHPLQEPRRRLRRLTADQELNHVGRRQAVFENADRVALLQVLPQGLRPGLRLGQRGMTEERDGPIQLVGALAVLRRVDRLEGVHEQATFQKEDRIDLRTVAVRQQATETSSVGIAAGARR